MVSMDCFFFFKAKSAYGLRLCGLSSGVCSSDLDVGRARSRSVAEQNWPRATEHLDPLLIEHRSAGQLRASNINAVEESADRLLKGKVGARAEAADVAQRSKCAVGDPETRDVDRQVLLLDRKRTRLNSSH